VIFVTAVEHTVEIVKSFLVEMSMGDNQYYYFDFQCYTVVTAGSSPVETNKESTVVVVVAAVEEEDYSPVAHCMDRN